MSDGAQMNARQAKAVAKLIEDEIGGLDEQVWIENEYALGGDLVKVSTPVERTGSHQTWLVGADGGVIQL